MTDSDLSRPPRRSVLAAVVLLLCVWASGCRETVKSLSELSRLHAAVVKEFHEKEVGVKLYRNMLTITFVNSPLNDKTPQERVERAEQTVALVKLNYAEIGKMHAIWVAFARSETHLVFLHTYQTVNMFGFDRNGRPLSEPREGPAADAAGTRPSADYSETLKQTDVVIEQMQLEGDSDYGMSLKAHFTVPGEATELKRSKSYPEFVSFDFSSYSEKSMFPGEPKIAAVADGKIVFQTAEQFSTSKSPDDGRFSEYLSLHIPYKAFQRMVAAKTLTLLLGDRAYELSGEHLQALREMTKYVRE